MVCTKVVFQQIYRMATEPSIHHRQEHPQSGMAGGTPHVGKWADPKSADHIPRSARARNCMRGYAMVAA